MHNLDLTISDISKIEGKANCDIKIREGRVEEVKFSIAEYKRFYTQAIRGKGVSSVAQLTSRICGTCSNAHIICALKAIENSQGITPSAQTIALRKLLNYGLLIRDHTLHLYVFVLPSLFGKDSLLDFDENDPHEHKYIDDTFAIKAAGNHLGKVVGGRSVHAPFPAVGGFTKLPSDLELTLCAQELEKIRSKVIDMIDLFASRDFTLIADDIDFAALLDSEYSFLSGEVIRSDNQTIPTQKYGEFLQRIDIPHSMASGYKLRNKVYMTGALARINLGKDKLHEETKKEVGRYLSLFPSKNIYHNNLSQAIEVLHAIDSSLSIIDNLRIQTEQPVSFVPHEGVGVGVIEAPRGILFYKLEVDRMGKIKTGQIVVPTGQNQICIEGCIRMYIEQNIGNLKDEENIEREVEKIVRAFDPCMSCASHFLKLRFL